jgi:penicillin-binding protein 2
MIGQRIRLILLAVVIVAGCLVLFYRLWFLQIEKQEEYINKQPVTDTARQRVPGTRGRILDRSGVEFARNETSMEIGLDLAAAEAAWNERERAKPRKERRKIPTFAFGPRKEETTDIIAVLNDLVFPELDRLKLYRVPAEGQDEEKKQEAMRRQQDAIILSYVSNKGVIPFPYETNLLQSDEEDFRRFTAYAENAPNIPGLTISERPKRRYPLKAMAGHLIGYIRENRNELPADEKKSDWDYIEAEDIGMAGLELSQNDKLRPRPGERIWRVNEHGRLTDEIKELRRDPLPGADVFLTLDARKQFIAEMALRDSGAGRAAAVVLDPNTGEVLAIASLPSYDPSIFLPPRDDAALTALYSRDSPFPPAVLPLALRADVPGSAFKLMTALAASISGKPIIHPYNCSGSVQIGNRSTKCMGTHGSLGMSDAIKRSCNAYFMQLSMAAKIENMQKITKLFHFGQQDFPMNTGIEVPEMEGNGRLYTANGRFSTHETALVGMGQGPINTTPLQMAMLAAAIGNGGKIYQPTLIHHYEEYQYDRDGRRQKRISEFKPKLLADLVQLGVKQPDLDIMREGMWKVVNEQGGTGIRARSLLWEIAGKTSTAQRKGKVWEDGKWVIKQDDRVWFIAYAPAEKPTIAVAVMVINGFAGGRVAAPIARRIIEQSLGLDNGSYQVTPTALEPAAGSYAHLAEVVFEGENVPAGETESPETPEAPESPDAPPGEEEPGAADPAGVAAEPIPPKAQIVPEDETPALTSQTLEPVKFRFKTDPPNPLRQPGTAP